MQEMNKKQNISMLSRIIFKNFKSNWKNYMLFFLSVVLSVTLVFSTFAIKEMLERFHSDERIYMGEGLFGILKNSLGIILALALIMMIFSTKYYIKTRISDYVLYIILGIQKRTMMFFIAGEYLCSILVALLTGILCGTLVSAVFRYVFNHINIQNHITNLPGSITIIMTIICCVLLFVVNAAINYETFYFSELTKAMHGEMAKESMPIKKFTPLAMIGILIVGVSYVLFGQRMFAESMKILILFFAGSYLIFIFGGAFVVNVLRNKKSFYYRNLLSLNNFYYKFQNNINYMFVIFVFHFLVFFSISSQIIVDLSPDKSKTIYPYDYVGIAFQDEIPYFEEIQSEYGGTCKVFPMIRLTVPGGNEEYTGGMTITPQGQHIGISESTYQSLGGGKLGLRNKEIHLVFQQMMSDRAHPLDWGEITGNPRLHMGPALNYMWWDRSNVFQDDYSVVGEERNNLLGYMVSGMQENIVVFSDSYFKQASTSAEGPTQLIVMNIPKENHEEVSSRLQTFAKGQKMKNVSSEYRADFHIKPVYMKDQMLKDAHSERVLRLTFHIFIAIALTGCEAFVFYIKTVSDVPFLKKKFRFLQCLGMRKKERCRHLKSELFAFALIPVFTALISSTGFIYIMMYLRWFTGQERSFYIQKHMIAIAIYFAIQVLLILISQCYLVKKVENANEKEARQQ